MLLRAISRLALATLVVTAAGPVPAQTASSTEVVQRFFAAASDTNLKVMGSLWGTAKGPAAATHIPADWERRLMVMGTFLQGTKVRTLGELANKEKDRRSVTTEISRGECRVVISVTTVRSPAGWLVVDFDLSEVGNINRGVCDGGNLGFF